MEILTGLLLGLSTLLFVGPVFFYLLESTIIHGKRGGVIAALGIIISDIIYVILLINGFSSFFDDPIFQKWFAIGGGFLLVALGVSYITQQKTMVQFKWNLSNKGLLAIGIKAFLLNFINPFVALVWVGFLTYNQSKFESQITIIASLITSLIIIFFTDILKVFLAARIKKIIKPKSLKKIQKLFGLLLLLFAIRLLYAAI